MDRFRLCFQELPHASTRLGGVEPGVQLVVAAAADVDTGGYGRFEVAAERTAEDVLERDETVAPPGQQL